MHNVATLLLAAGSSSRLGSSKQLLVWQNKTLLQRSIDTAREADIGPLVVVLGAREEAHRKEIDHHITVLTNLHWTKGMGSSLKEGIQYIQQLPVDGVLVMVCDQPLLTSDHLKKLVQAFQRDKKNIVASSYRDTLGVPALFHRACFEELLSIGDQEGAKVVIQKNKHLTTAIPFPDGALDIDLPEDAERLKQIKKT